MSTDGDSQPFPQDPGNRKQDRAPRGGMRPWMKLLLAASLAANLAVAGLAIGAALRWHDREHPGHRPPTVGSMIFRNLDRETRLELRRRAAGEYGSHADRRRTEGEAVIAALRSDPFDAQQLERLLREHADARYAFQLSVHEAWLAQLGKMTPKERKRYARRLEENLRNYPEWRKDHDR